MERDWRVPSVNRRTMIQTMGGLGALGLAGCLGDDDGGGDDSPGDADSDGDGDSDDDGDDGFPDPQLDIRAIIPYSAGGGFDYYVRTIAPYVEDHLPGDPTIVPENVTGAAGLVGMNELWGSDPDGYTYAMVNPTGGAWSQFGLPEETEFEVSQFSYLGQVAVIRYGITQRADMDPIESWDDFAAAITEGSFGTSGVGGTEHLFPIIMGSVTGDWEADDIHYVHFEGAADVLAAMDRGEVDFTLSASGTALPHIEDGTVDPVFLINDEPVPGWEDFTLLSDWDVPGVDQIIDVVQIPRLWAAPPDTPQDVVDAYDEAFMAAAEDEGFQADAEEAERTISPLSASEAQSLSEAVEETWAEEEELLLELLE